MIQMQTNLEVADNSLLLFASVKIYSAATDQLSVLTAMLLLSSIIMVSQSVHVFLGLFLVNFVPKIT